MVLIRNERNNKKVDYDYWVEVQQSKRFAKDNKSMVAEVKKEIKNLLEE